MVRIGHHQVGIHGQTANRPQAADHVQPEQQVGHKVSVGHVEVQHVGPGGFQAAHGRLDMAHVNTHDRRRHWTGRPFRAATLGKAAGLAARGLAASVGHTCFR